MNPYLGMTVIYRSRTGNYSCAAIVTAVQSSLHRPNVEKGFLPDLSAESSAHLSVLTPGSPGKTSGDPFIVESDQPAQSPNNGIYQEWNVPYDTEAGPGTWRTITDEEYAARRATRRPASGQIRPQDRSSEAQAPSETPKAPAKGTKPAQVKK